MILLIESDRIIQKKLCDMLHRERIIPVQEKKEILEALVRHRNNFDVLVANIQSLREILAEGILNKLCEKINIRIPPIVAIYRNGQESIIRNTNASKYQCKFLKYDENDLNFPVTYAQTIKTVHPKVNIDINRANEVWLNPQNPQDIVDIQEWLGEEGFIDVSVKSKPKVQPKPQPTVQVKPPPKAPAKTEELKEVSKEAEKESDDMYSELEKKYKELLQCYEDLKKES